jgi:molybdopterin/thiamine biosynthesis adenylyltransferase
MIDPIEVDNTRHYSIFSGETFGSRRVDVIGVGATGSKTVVELAKKGVQNLHVWDFDRIESHNIANQAYFPNQVGMLKVEALGDIIRQFTGLEIVQHPEKVDGTQPMGNVVFLMPDKMSARKEIWQRGLRLKPNIDHIIETRMGVDSGRVYSFSPIVPAQFREWEGTLYDDNDADVERAPCGTAITVGATAEIVTGIAVWQFIQWFAVSSGARPNDVLYNEVVFSTRPFFMEGRTF